MEISQHTEQFLNEALRSAGAAAAPAAGNGRFNSSRGPLSVSLAFASLAD